jgi:hypothetical protein
MKLTLTTETPGAEILLEVLLETDDRLALDEMRVALHRAARSLKTKNLVPSETPPPPSAEENLVPSTTDARATEIYVYPKSQDDDPLGLGEYRIFASISDAADFFGIKGTSLSTQLYAARRDGEQSVSLCEGKYILWRQKDHEEWLLANSSSD